MAKNGHGTPSSGQVSAFPGASTIFASTASKGGFGTIVTGSRGYGKSFGTEEAADEKSVEYHSQMLPIWISELNPDDDTDYTHVPTGYLRDLYPYVYYWGPKAEILVANLQRINAIRNQDLIDLEHMPGYTEELQKGSLTEDLLLTYNDTKLAQILLKEDVPSLLAYLLVLHEQKLFRIAYRNVSTAEVHEENLVATTTKDTPLHDYYKSPITRYIPAAWNTVEEGYAARNRIDTILSVFVRICLASSVMQQIDVVAGDWEKHVAFCERWDLIP